MASSLNVINAEGSEMEEGRQANENEMEIANFEQFEDLAERYNDMANIETNDQEMLAMTINFTKFLGAFADNLFTFKEEELNRYSRMMADMTTRYKDNPKLLKHITKWCDTRKELIKTANLVANELDRNIQAVYINQILGLSVELLTSLNLGIYHELCSSIESYVSSISPPLGSIVKWALTLAPYLKYTGVLSSFCENLRSEVLIHRVLKAMKDDENEFKPLKDWFDQTEELEASVKQLFPYEIDRKIIENIEKYLSDLGEDRKIFATAIMANIKKDRSLFKNKKLFSKVALFCKSDAAKEWYKRMLTGARPLNLESSMVYFRNELQQLEEVDAKPGMAIEIGNFTLQESFLPRVLLCGMNVTSAYYCYEKLKSGTKHRYSIGLRDLVKNAELFYYTMEEIRERRERLVR